MSDAERESTSRMPWMGQRVCIVCHKIDWIDDRGRCRRCAADSEDLLQMALAVKELEERAIRRADAIGEIARANDRLRAAKEAKRKAREHS